VILSIMLSLFLKYMVHASLSGLCSEHFQCFIFWFVQFEDNFEWTCSTTALQYNGKCSGGGGEGHRLILLPTNVTKIGKNRSKIEGFNKTVLR
jgi:hypothetical protein